MLGRRRWERYRKELDVVIAGANGESVSGRTQDICEGGLGIVCADALRIGDDYRFSIAEIGAEPLVGTVRWCTPSTSLGGNLIGVELTSLRSGQVEALADRIARWKAEDAGAGDG